MSVLLKLLSQEQLSFYLYCSENIKPKDALYILKKSLECGDWGIIDDFIGKYTKTEENRQKYIDSINLIKQEMYNFILKFNIGFLPEMSIVRHFYNNCGLPNEDLIKISQVMDPCLTCETVKWSENISEEVKYEMGKSIFLHEGNIYIAFIKYAYDRRDFARKIVIENIANYKPRDSKLEEPFQSFIQELANCVNMDSDRFNYHLEKLQAAKQLTLKK